MIEAWEAKQFGKNKARYAREFNFHRPDVSRIINEHEKKKCRNNSPR
jgi:hypothetical protein